MDKIEFREIIELFLFVSVHELKSGSEVPKVSFIFPKDDIKLFEDIVEKPFTKEGYWIPNATKDDIDFLLNNDDDCWTINVSDSVEFFKCLMDITNSLIELYSFYEIKGSPRNLAMHIMRRIWLRMGNEDFANVEDFLKKQLQFINNRTLDTLDSKKIDTFFGYDVFEETILNATYHETTRRMAFTIKNNEEKYELPYILYDIDDDGICYIYAVQSSKNHKSKKIERKLYKLNKDIDNPNVHPSNVYALILFINQLQKKGITKIIVPGMQVLSYDFHILLADIVKNDLIEAENRLKRSPNDKYYQRKYEELKDWYNNVYNKEDLISYLKTEELFNLIYRLTLHNPSIEIVNELNIQGDFLQVNIK